MRSSTYARAVRAALVCACASLAALAIAAAIPPGAFAAPPANDAFADAVPVTLDGSGYAIVNGTTLEATGEVDEPATSGSTNSVWYVWTATSSRPMTLDTSGCDYDSYLYVFTGAALNALTLELSDDDSGSGVCSLATWTPNLGTTYYIRIDGYSNNTGNFPLAFQEQQPSAPNDEFAGAETLVLSAGTTFVDATLSSATGEGSEPTGSGALTTLWYAWTAPNTNAMRVHTDGCTTNTWLDVFTGATLPTLQRIASDDSSGTPSQCASISFVPESGVTYFIRVDGANSSTGPFTLQLDTLSGPFPPNDRFANAEVLPLPGQGSVSTSGTNVGATLDAGEPTASGAVHSVWYRWTSPATPATTARIDTNGCTTDVVAYLYTGASLASLTEVGSDDSSGTPSQCASIYFPVAASTTYWIRIDGTNAITGTFPVNLTHYDTPPNDHFENAELVVLDGGGLASTSGTTIAATPQPGEPSSYSSSSVWYRWDAPVVLPGDGPLVVDTNGCNHDTYLYVFSGTSISTLATIGSDDDSGTSNCSLVSFVPVAGMTYYFRVSALGTRGSTMLNAALKTRPPHDHFADAAPMVLNGSGIADYTTTDDGATNEPGEPGASGSNTSVWFTWSPPAHETVRASIVNCDRSMRLDAYVGIAVNALTSVASRGTTTCPSMELSLDAGQTVRFRADGYQGETGSVRLQLARITPPPNDDFGNATVLVLDGAGVATASDSTANASAQLDEPYMSGYSNSLWYEWTAASTAPVTIDTTGCSGYSYVSVYTGATLATLASAGPTTLTTSSGGCRRVRLDPTVGTTYRIRTYMDETGPLPLRVTQHQAPANDDFANAQLLTLVNGSAAATGTTVLATGEAGEPAASGTTESIWYDWTAPDNQTVQVDTNDCLHDTVLYVYTGASVATLTQVATDDNSGSPSTCSSLTFTPSTGATYHLRIDAKSATQDETEIRINRVVVPANDMFANAENVTLVGGLATLYGSTTAATGEAGEPSASGAITSVWYRWVPTHGSPIDISTLGCSFDTIIYLYEGSSLSDIYTPSWSNDYNDDGPAGHGRCSRYTFAKPMIGTTYYIRVDGKAGSNGGFPIEFRQRTPPANDDIANAELMTGWITSATGNGINASREVGESSTAGYFASVWYRWTAPMSGITSLSLSNCSQPMGLGVTTSSGYPVSFLEYADHYYSPDCKNLTFNAVAGTTYRIKVGFGYYFNATSDATFTLSINSPPNDDFANATALTATTTTPSAQYRYDDEYTVGADHEPGEPMHAGDAGGSSVWYSFTPTTTQTWAVDVYGPYASASFNTLLGVYTGSSVAALTQVASNDDAPNAPRAGLSRVVFTGTAGTTYYIAVDGKAAATGRFGIRIGNDAPANDDLANAQAVAGLSFQATGSLNLATLETAETSTPYDEGTASVWYRYVAPSSGWLLLDTVGTATSVAVDAFSGSAYPLVALGPSQYAEPDNYSYASSSYCNPAFSSPRPRIQVVAGQTYSIRVSNESASPTAFRQFTLRGTLNGAAAPNDAFAAAIPLTDRDERCFDTVFAGTQPGEPVHAGVAGGASLWYTYTPTVSGVAQISASPYTNHSYRDVVEGQTLDPIIALYTGNAVGSLVEVASNDDAPFSSEHADVRVALTAGVTYRIAVDTVGGDARLGAINVNPVNPWSLNVRDGLGPDIDFTTDNTSLSANLSSPYQWDWFHREAVDWAAYRDGYGGSCTAPELSTSTLASSVTFPGPIADGDWVMCVRTRTVFAQSDWSSTDSVIIDTGATSPSPLVDGATLTLDADYQSNTGTLRATWAASLDPSGVTRYETCYASAVDASGCIGTVLAGWTNVGLATSHVLTGQALAEGSVWYVCVRTTDTLAQTAVACTDGSMIDTFAPTNPVSIWDLSTTFSSDGDLHGIDVHVTASWSAGADAASGVRDYDACISTSAASCVPATGTTMQTGNTSRVLDIAVTSTTLGSGSTLYTCVRTNDNASNAAANWACSDGFVVDAGAPLVPTHVSPADGTLDLDSTPTLVATYDDPFPATPGYLEFRVGSSVTCGVAVVASGSSGAPQASGSTPAFTVGSALAPARYYWCARAIDNAGNASAWSSTRVVIVEGSSSIDLTGCAAGALDLGSLPAGSSTTTSSSCTIGFGSADGTAMIRVAQTDGSGNAMVSGGDSIPDFAGSFGGGGAFGMCTEAVAAGAVATGVAGAGNCVTSSPGVWASVPASPRKLANTTVVGTQNAQVSMRFGLGASSSQPAGAYVADITWTVIAPNF